MSVKSRTRTWSASIIVVATVLVGGTTPHGQRTLEQPQRQAQRDGQNQPAGRQSQDGSAAGDISKAQFDRWMTQLSNWGRWGKEDQLGALNLITAAKRQQAAALVKTGTTVSLSRPLALGKDANTSRAINTGGSLNNMFFINAAAEWIMERHEIEYHGGRLTHLDALCHVAYNGKVYNGRSFNEVATLEGGCPALGVAALKNGIVTRGILVDLPGKSVQRGDIEAWEKQAAIKIGPGDALLLRTGRIPGQETRSGNAGYHPSLAPFFKERDIALLGSDVAQEGGTVAGVSIPIHRFALVALGVHLLDNLDLQGLAETATRLKRWEFLLVTAPLAVSNGAGSAVNPIAVF